MISARITCAGCIGESDTSKEGMRPFQGPTVTWEPSSLSLLLPLLGLVAGEQDENLTTLKEAAPQTGCLLLSATTAKSDTIYIKQVWAIMVQK